MKKLRLHRSPQRVCSFESPIQREDLPNLGSGGVHYHPRATEAIAVGYRQVHENVASVTLAGDLPH